MQDVAAIGGRIILVTDQKGAAEATVSSMETLTLPEMPSTVTPLVYAIPVQLIAYHTAVMMGTDVDQPRNLAKSVTVEYPAAAFALYRSAAARRHFSILWPPVAAGHTTRHD